MATTQTPPSTPLTPRADRGDERVRLIEEAVLLIRGEWPAVAAGLCESVNRASGLLFVPAAELEEAVERTSREAIRVVERLFGREAALEVRRAAEPLPASACPSARDAAPAPRSRLAFRPRHRVRARAGW